MVTTTREATESERLARIEATLDLLVRQNSDIREDIRALSGGVREDIRALSGEVKEDIRALDSDNRADMRDIRGEMRDVREEIRDVRKSSRTHFFWTLGVLIGLLGPTLAGLVVNFILNG